MVELSPLYAAAPYACGALIPGFEQGMLLCVLGLAAFFDCRVRRIPNRLVLAALGGWALLAVAGLCLGAVRPAVLAARVVSGLLLSGGACALALALYRITGRVSLGGGDVKLLAVLGLYLGFVRGVFAVVIACALAVAWQCARALLTMRGAGCGRRLARLRSATFAFAPWLLAGAALVVARMWWAG